MKIPEEYKLTCNGCGEILDIRDPSVLSHGWIEKGKSVCYTNKPLVSKYSGSRELGKSILWTKNKEDIGLN